MLIFNPYGLSLRIVPINPGDFTDDHVISGLGDHHYGNYRGLHYLKTSVRFFVSQSSNILR